MLRARIHWHHVPLLLLPFAAAFGLGYCSARGAWGQPPPSLGLALYQAGHTRTVAPGPLYFANGELARGTLNPNSAVLCARPCDGGRWGWDRPIKGYLLGPEGTRREEVQAAVDARCGLVGRLLPVGYTVTDLDYEDALRVAYGASTVYADVARCNPDRPRVRCGDGDCDYPEDVRRADGRLVCEADCLPPTATPEPSPSPPPPSGPGTPPGEGTFSCRPVPPSCPDVQLYAEREVSETARAIATRVRAYRAEVRQWTARQRQRRADLAACADAVEEELFVPGVLSTGQTVTVICETP